MKINKQYLLNNLWWGENSRERNRPQHLRGLNFLELASLPQLVMPNTFNVWGIDISHWNLPGVDLQRMKNVYNLQFVIIKGMDGTIKSRYFDEHKAEAKAAGLPWGIYDWLYPDNRVSVDAQVNAWWNQAIADPPPLGNFFDAEWTYYAGQPANPTASDLRKAHNKWKAKGGRPATTYTAPGYAKEYLIGFDWNLEELWDANYGVLVPNLPQGATNYTFWQFTDKLDGKALDPNGNAELDGDYFHGSRADFDRRYNMTTPSIPAIVDGYQKIRAFDNDVYIWRGSLAGKRVIVTNPHGELKTVSSVAAGSLVAINCDGWRDGENKPLSLAASDGDLYQPIQYDFRPYENISPAGVITIDHLYPANYNNLFSGSRYIVRNGINPFLNDTDPEHISIRRPRTAAGKTADGQQVLCVVGGWSAASYLGVTLKELGDLMIAAGAVTAFDCDGGRSSAMAYQGENVNLDHGGEDAVVNHLIIYEGVNTMDTWKALQALNVRSGPASTYAIAQSLAKDDKVEGVLDAVSGWINISKIIRVNGATFAPVAPKQWWCSGGAAYVTLLNPAPPPPPPPPPTTEPDKIVITVTKAGITTTYTITGTIIES